MTAPEVDWTLTQLGSVVGSITTPLRRVDRDESELFESDIRERKGELEKANYVGAALDDRSTTARGPGYDHHVEAVVGVRIVGLHHSEWGHVDPDGVDGIPWDELVRRIRDALLAERNYPSINSPDGTYHTLEITNESPQSANYRDYYRHDFDVLLHGEEDL